MLGEFGVFAVFVRRAPIAPVAMCGQTVGNIVDVELSWEISTVAMVQPLCGEHSAWSGGRVGSSRTEGAAMRRTLVSVALVAMVLAAAACVADPPPPQKVSPAGVGIAVATPPSTLNGRTVRVSYDGGVTETLIFGPDGKSVSFVAADRPATASAAVEPLESGVFLVTWTHGDDVISQVQDFLTGELHGTWSHRTEPAAPYIVETRTGSVRLAE